MARDPSPEVAALIFEAATQRVDGQRSSIDNLRSRASGLLGASAIATSFFAGFALTDRPTALSVWSYIGFLSAGLVAVLLAGVLYPRKGWRFGHRPGFLVSEYYRGEAEDLDEPPTLQETQIFLSQHMQGWIETNKKKLQSAYLMFEFAAALVVISVVAWMIDLVQIARTT